jgi:hypothetical protein
MDEKREITWVAESVRQFAGERSSHPVVLSGGGLGDLMKALAFCTALRRIGTGIEALCLVFGKIGRDADAGSLGEAVVRGNPAVDLLIEHDGVAHERMLRGIYTIPRRFFEVQPATVRSWYWDNTAAQCEADMHLAPYRCFSDHMPVACRSLMEAGESQWEMLSHSAGFTVKPSDMFIAPGKMPGWYGGERYVVVNNGSGGNSRLKRIPNSVLGEVCSAFTEREIMVVQVGLKTEDVAPNALDMRGLGIHDSAELIRNAAMYIGPEGGMSYVALAVDTPGVIFYGPTPVNVFHAPGQMWVSERKCRPCWWSRVDWGATCGRGCSVCDNMPKSGSEIGKRLAEMVVHEGTIE